MLYRESSNFYRREDAKFFAESSGNKTIKVSSNSVCTSYGEILALTADLKLKQKNQIVFKYFPEVY